MGNVNLLQLQAALNGMMMMLAGSSISKKIMYKRKESGLGYFSNRLLQHRSKQYLQDKVDNLVLALSA